jgi:hypothetical protein
MSEKDWIIILCNENGIIVGFSTIQIIPMKIDSQDYTFLFSGDTAVSKKYRQQSTLAGSFIHFMMRMIDEMDGTDCYWLLISKGYRTYRFLPVFFKTFYPVYNIPTPVYYQKLINQFCMRKYNDAFNVNSGIVEFAGKKDFLKPEICTIVERKQNDPHVQYFLHKNPQYYLGNELACITHITYRNFNPVLNKVLKKTKVLWNE